MADMMGRTSELYRNNKFIIRPELGVLNNMLFITEQYLSRKLVGGFELDKMARQLMNEGKIDEEYLYPFEDVTWETVFSNLKCLEFYDFHSDPDMAKDVGGYLNFMDYVHDADTDALLQNQTAEIKRISGLIMIETWSNVKTTLFDSLLNLDFNRDKLISVVLNSVVSGLAEAIEKYNDMLDEESNDPRNAYLGILDGMRDLYVNTQYDEGALVKSVYASIIKGAEVLICNPEYLPFGDRLNSASKYFIAGGSIFVVNKFKDMLEQRGIDVAGVLGEEVALFFPALVSCSISCVCIVALDHNPVLQRLTAEFNKIPTLTYEIRQLRESAERFEQLAAELASIDIEALKKEIDAYTSLAVELESIKSPADLNNYLMGYYKQTGKELPWGNRTVEEHWADPNSRLVFK